MTSTHYELGHRLLAHEAGAGPDPIDVVTAGEAVFRKLHGRLSVLFGREGCHGLLIRALSLATREHPLLATAEAVRLPAATPAAEVPLRGLRECAADNDPATVEEALATMIGAYIWLLDRFIGPAITVRELQRIWPAFPFPAAGSDNRRASNE